MVVYKRSALVRRCKKITVLNCKRGREDIDKIREKSLDKDITHHLLTIRPLVGVCGLP